MSASYFYDILAYHTVNTFTSFFNIFANYIAIAFFDSKG